MNEQILQLETSIANIKADIKVLENALDVLKVNDSAIFEKVAGTQNSIIELKLNHSNTINSVTSNLNNLEKDINFDLTTLKQETAEIKLEVDELKITINEFNTNIEQINTTLTNLSSNSLLYITSQLTVKQIIAVVGILILAVSSPGVLTDWAFGNNNNNEATEKLDKLIEILEPES